MQHCAHHWDRKKRFEKPVAVPVEDADRIAGLDAELFQRGRKPSDALSELTVGKARSIAINDLLIRRLQQRRVPQLLQDQGILIGGLGDLDQPSDHGGLPRTRLSLRPSASAIVIERIAW